MGRRARQLDSGGDTVSRREHVQLLRVADVGNHFPGRLPEEWKTPYAVRDEDWPDARRKPQSKYLSRIKNMRRAFNRIQLYFPELLTLPPQDVFELSTAHGAMLDILRDYGHHVVGNDYVNMVGASEGEEARALFRKANDDSFSRKTDDYGLPIPEDGKIDDWPYRPIIDSLGLDMALFDAGRMPYPFDDKSFDYVMSFQAIEHYCHPNDWHQVVDEMCRISRKCVFVMLNPMLPNLAADKDYAAAFEAFRESMRGYDRNGFTCIGVHLHWGQALGFKLMAF